MGSRLEKVSKICKMVYAGTRVLLGEVKKLRKEIKRLKEEEETRKLQLEEREDNDDDEDDDEDEDEDDGDEDKKKEEDKGTDDIHYQQVIPKGHKSPLSNLSSGKFHIVEKEYMSVNLFHYFNVNGI
ncbi:nucleolar protein 12-like [Rhododendron vialii]|uniref:nucleolar protein 12-like n=1 Tax=Rhododendron vialii TaxID=182163 RepID=UPI00265ED446|nr:nucleolar protein 12-like [Rhododendron vialii]